MNLKGVRTSSNLDPSSKKAIIEKRLESLRKQANELSILCGIEIGLIVFAPGENNPYTWPSSAKAKDIVREYLACPEDKRLNNLFNLEKHLQLAVNAREDYINKIEQMVEEMEIETLFNQLVEGAKTFNELGVREINGLKKLFAVKRIKLEERKKTLNEDVEKEIGSNEQIVGEETDGHP
ncbi:agamous-like MADS-box protein AGL80 [Lycium barbarum]|uniref:agamous-like MADS-box protein AGL80 n=1 Tax=Lycium barbarum TaxID=112863 RepID=UPI00293F2274|nr:agamous-like MADS-box protein AGL80 [Lycium barbarum]